MVSAVALASEFKQVFMEMMSEQISDSSASIVDMLWDSRSFVIRDGQDQDLLFQQKSNLNDFFVTRMPDSVLFDSARLTEWAKEAILFANRNAEHSEFENIFSERIHYGMIISSMMRYRFSTAKLKEYLRDELRIRSAYLADKYPPEIQSLIMTWSRKSIAPTLRELARDLVVREANRPIPRSAQLSLVTRVKKEPSFRDVRGAVPFTLENEHLVIGGPNLEGRAQEYRALLDRALKNLEESNCLQRIHNMDPVVGRLVTEYKLEISKAGSLPVANLMIIGQEIDNKIKIHQSKSWSEDALDDEDLFFVNSFMAAHNLYLQCFDMTNKIMEDMERSALLYQRLDTGARTAPWGILATLGSTESIIETRSGQAMKRASAGLMAGTETRGLIAIGLGLLRGALHALGGLLVGAATRILSKAAISLGKDGLLEALKHEGIYQNMLIFIQTHFVSILHLVRELPSYFGWLRSLLHAFGIR